MMVTGVKIYKFFGRQRGINIRYGGILCSKKAKYTPFIKININGTTFNDEIAKYLR